MTSRVRNLIPSPKFPALTTCKPACTTMGVTAMLTSKEECKTCTNKAVTLVFGKSITVSREMQAYPLLSLLAEVQHLAKNSLFKNTLLYILSQCVYIDSAEPKVGGYLGLTLGVSLTDLRTAAIKLVGLWRVERKERTMFRHWMKSQPFLSFLQKMFFFW